MIHDSTISYGPTVSAAPPPQLGQLETALGRRNLDGTEMRQTCPTANAATLWRQAAKNAPPPCSSSIRAPALQWNRSLFQHVPPAWTETVKRMRFTQPCLVSMAHKSATGSSLTLTFLEAKTSVPLVWQSLINKRKRPVRKDQACMECPSWPIQVLSVILVDGCTECWAPRPRYKTSHRWARVFKDPCDTESSFERELRGFVDRLARAMRNSSFWGQTVAFRPRRIASSTLGKHASCSHSKLHFPDPATLCREWDTAIAASSLGLAPDLPPRVLLLTAQIRDVRIGLGLAEMLPLLSLALALGPRDRRHRCHSHRRRGLSECLWSSRALSAGELGPVHMLSEVESELTLQYPWPKHYWSWCRVVQDKPRCQGSYESKDRSTHDLPAQPASCQEALAGLSHHPHQFCVAAPFGSPGTTGGVPHWGNFRMAGLCQLHQRVHRLKIVVQDRGEHFRVLALRVFSFQVCKFRPLQSEVVFAIPSSLMATVSWKRMAANSRGGGDIALATTLASLTRSAISVTPNCFKFICFLKYLPVSEQTNWPQSKILNLWICHWAFRVPWGRNDARIRADKCIGSKNLSSYALQTRCCSKSSSELQGLQRDQDHWRP